MTIIWLALLAPLVVFLAIFHFTNPYAKQHIFKSPYSTSVDKGGIIEYTQHYHLKVYTSALANALGYIKSGFLIVQNTFFGGKPAEGKTAAEIIGYIHRERFNPAAPYLISGDQFSVLYTRNLGVFYNQLLDPNTAHNQVDWENRQRLYLQSVLVAIDGLSATADPRTTIVPMGRKSVVLTQVHPGGVGSDQVYGLFYALSQLLTQQRSHDRKYHRQTGQAAARLLRERHNKLQFIFDSYIKAVYNSESGMVRHDIHLASARDGVIRVGSLYDNIILHETIRLASSLGLRNTIADRSSSTKFAQEIKAFYWNGEAGYYNDDSQSRHFSSDWLIGYVTGFFDLTNDVDLRRTLSTIDYIESNKLADPLPIKYQVHGESLMPYFVRRFVPAYGMNAIWSYWGAQYITLLADVYEQTRDKRYLTLGLQYIKRYEECIVRDAGFAETFDAEGKFLRTPLYKSIRITGWVVQYEHAADKLHRLSAQYVTKSTR